MYTRNQLRKRIARRFCRRGGVDACQQMPCELGLAAADAALEVLAELHPNDVLDALRESAPADSRYDPTNGVLLQPGRVRRRIDPT